MGGKASILEDDDDKKKPDGRDFGPPKSLKRSPYGRAARDEMKADVANWAGEKARSILEDHPDVAESLGKLAPWMEATDAVSFAPARALVAGEPKTALKQLKKGAGSIWDSVTSDTLPKDSILEETPKDFSEAVEKGAIKAGVDKDTAHEYGDIPSLAIGTAMAASQAKDVVKGAAKLAKGSAKVAAKGGSEALKSLREFDAYFNKSLAGPSGKALGPRGSIPLIPKWVEKIYKEKGLKAAEEAIVKHEARTSGNMFDGEVSARTKKGGGAGEVEGHHESNFSELDAEDAKPTTEIDGEQAPDPDSLAKESNAGLGDVVTRMSPYKRDQFDALRKVRGWDKAAASDDQVAAFLQIADANPKMAPSQILKQLQEGYLKENRLAGKLTKAEPAGRGNVGQQLFDDKGKLTEAGLEKANIPQVEVKSRERAPDVKAAEGFEKWGKQKITELEAQMADMLKKNPAARNTKEYEDLGNSISTIKARIRDSMPRRENKPEKIVPRGEGPAGPDGKRPEAMIRSHAEEGKGLAILSRGEDSPIAGEGARTYLDSIPFYHNDTHGGHYSLLPKGKGEYKKFYTRDKLQGEIRQAILDKDYKLAAEKRRQLDNLPENRGEEAEGILNPKMDSDDLEFTGDVTKPVPFAEDVLEQAEGNDRVQAYRSRAANRKGVASGKTTKRDTYLGEADSFSPEHRTVAKGVDQSYRVTPNRHGGKADSSRLPMIPKQSFTFEGDSLLEGTGKLTPNRGATGLPKAKLEKSKFKPERILDLDGDSGEEAFDRAATYYKAKAKKLTAPAEDAKSGKTRHMGRSIGDEQHLEKITDAEGIEDLGLGEEGVSEATRKALRDIGFEGADSPSLTEQIAEMALEQHADGVRKPKNGLNLEKDRDVVVPDRYKPGQMRVAKDAQDLEVHAQLKAHGYTDADIDDLGPDLAREMAHGVARHKEKILNAQMGTSDVLKAGVKPASEKQVGAFFEKYGMADHPATQDIRKTSRFIDYITKMEDKARIGHTGYLKDELESLQAALKKAPDRDTAANIKGSIHVVQQLLDGNVRPGMTGKYAPSVLPGESADQFIKRMVKRGYSKEEAAYLADTLGEKAPSAPQGVVEKAQEGLKKAEAEANAADAAREVADSKRDSTPSSYADLYDGDPATQGVKAEDVLDDAQLAEQKALRDKKAAAPAKAEAPKKGSPPSEAQMKYYLAELNLPADHLFMHDAPARQDFIGYFKTVREAKKLGQAKELEEQLAKYSKLAAEEQNPRSAAIYKAKRNVLEDALGKQVTATERLSADSKAGDAAKDKAIAETKPKQEVKQAAGDETLESLQKQLDDMKESAFSSPEAHAKATALFKKIQEKKAGKK